MNEISIIINGVRYDAFETEDVSCTFCDLKSILTKGESCKICRSLGKLNMIFNKSTKSFER